MAKQGKADFYKILVEEGATEATIMLYGFIGENWTYNGDGEWEQAGITDLEFVQELKDLAEKYSIINIRINSPGGSTLHGGAIMTAIQSCPAEVHTWNDGVCASMAADIWLCGHKRHMAKNAMLMIHSAWDICMGHAQDMRDCAEYLDKVNAAVISGVAASTGKSEDEIMSAYYADYKDHWLTYNDAVADGLVTETADNYTAADAQKLDNMTYKQLIQHFEQKNHPEAPGLMKQIKDAFMQRVGALGRKFINTTVTQTTPDMTFQEFQNALTDGSLDLAAVETELAAHKAANQPAPTAEALALKAVQDEMAALKAELSALKAAPGAGKSTPPQPEGDPAPPAIDQPGKMDALKTFNEIAAQAASQDEVLRFMPSAPSTQTQNT